MRTADLNGLRLKAEMHNWLAAASIEITLRCNQRCVHCLRNLSDRDGLTYEQVCQVLDQLAGLGCMKVLFTGGEPFVRHDFLDVVAYAWDRRFAIDILTNGTLITPAMAAELKRWHVSELQASMYAADPDIHDAITTIPGSHASTLRGIRLARQHGLRVRVAMPVMAANVDQARAVESLCDELGATLVQGWLLYPKHDGDRGPLDLLATDAQLQCLVASDGGNQGRGSPDQQPASFGPALCSAGREQIGIGADGTIYPCGALRLPLGTIHTHSLSEVWAESQPLLNLRADRRQHPIDCQGCSVRRQCMWCPGLSMQLMGNPALPNPQDCRRTRLRYSHPEADAAGWSVPTYLRQVQCSGASAYD